MAALQVTALQAAARPDVQRAQPARADMPGFLREHGGPVAFSVALHGLLVIALVAGALISVHRTEPVLQPLPIDAVVVDSQMLRAAQKVNADRVEAAAAAARAQADAQAAEAARVQAEAAAAETARVQAEAAAADAGNAQAKAAAQAAEAAAATAAAAEAQARATREAQATVKAEARRDALAADRAAAQAAVLKAAQLQQRKDVEKSAAAADAKRAADAQRVAQAAQAKQVAQAQSQAQALAQAADAKKTADLKQAADARKAAEDHARRERESELQTQLAEEERRSAVQSGPLRDRYIASLRDKIQGVWIKPPSANAGIDCTVAVTQVVGGEVTAVHVTQCNGDAAVRQSIENAVYRASPLPDPPDPALFEKNFIFRFRPND